MEALSACSCVDKRVKIDSKDGKPKGNKVFSAGVDYESEDDEGKRIIKRKFKSEAAEFGEQEDFQGDNSRSRLNPYTTN